MNLIIFLFFIFFSIIISGKNGFCENNCQREKKISTVGSNLIENLKDFKFLTF
jgi:hypothetical protein